VSLARGKYSPTLRLDCSEIAAAAVT
jgi:hypothetical protein